MELADLQRYCAQYEDPNPIAAMPLNVLLKGRPYTTATNMCLLVGVPGHIKGARQATELEQSQIEKVLIKRERTHCVNANDLKAWAGESRWRWNELDDPADDGLLFNHPVNRIYISRLLDIFPPGIINLSFESGNAHFRAGAIGAVLMFLRFVETFRNAPRFDSIALPREENPND